MKPPSPELMVCPLPEADGDGNWRQAPHDWAGATEHSLRLLQRYTCRRCGAWGHRSFSKYAKLGDVRPYTVAGPKKTRVLRKVPDPLWARWRHEDSPRPDPPDEAAQSERRMTRHLRSERR